MCGRFYVDPDDTVEGLAALLDQLNRREQQRDPGFSLKRGEISPGDAAAVLALNRQRKPSVFAMRWGYRMDKRLIFNARSETASARPMFAQSMQLRRCIIPASAYFEWDHREAKPSKYRFTTKDEPIVYLAGLYRLEEDGPAFTVLTRDAAPDIACFHDRMPVIAHREQISTWLDQTADPSLLLGAPNTQLSWFKA